MHQTIQQNYGVMNKLWSKTLIENAEFKVLMMLTVKSIVFCVCNAMYFGDISLNYRALQPIRLYFS
jgi:hypothetical protein